MPGVDDAGRIGLPEVNLGILPGTGGTQRLPRLIGRLRAIELMGTGRTIAFEEALEMHLIDYVFDHDEFWTHILEYAQQFVPPQKASKAVGQDQEGCLHWYQVPLPEGVAVECELQQRLFDGSDAAEGLEAYVNKAVPRFKGVYTGRVLCLQRRLVRTTRG